MMTRFLRLLVRIRYWKRRALTAERKCLDLIETQAVALAALEAEYDGEMWRNRSREDMFVSASIMGGRNLFGVAPRTGPALNQKLPSPLEAAQPIMTGADRMEFEQYWWPDALRNNVSRQQAEKDFLEELTKRKALNDEPMM